MHGPMRYRLEHYPLIIKQEVTRGDMGAHGHVNNVVYFRYMENARVERSRRIAKYEFEQGISELQKRENPFPTSTSRGIHG